MVQSCRLAMSAQRVLGCVFVWELDCAAYRVSAQLAGRVVCYVLCGIAEQDIGLGKVLVFKVRVAVVCSHFVLLVVLMSLRKISPVA